MDRKDEFYVIPCNCAGFEHSMVFHASQFKGKDLYLTIRYPLHIETKCFLTRIKNIVKRKFEFTFNIVIDAPYFPLFEYLWKISFPGKVFEYEVMDMDPHWKLYFMTAKITLGFRMSFERIMTYLRYGVLDYPFEIFIDHEGPSASNYEKIF